MYFVTLLNNWVATMVKNIQKNSQNKWERILPCSVISWKKKNFLKENSADVYQQF